MQDITQGVFPVSLSTIHLGTAARVISIDLLPLIFSTGLGTRPNLKSKSQTPYPAEGLARGPRGEAALQSRKVPEMLSVHKFVCHLPVVTRRSASAAYAPARPPRLPRKCRWAHV